MSQEQQIINWLSRGRPLTPVTAMKHFRCMRLASRILDLRRKGHDIQTHLVKLSSGSTIARYTLMVRP